MTRQVSGLSRNGPLAHYGEKRPVKQHDQYMGLVLLAQQMLQTVNIAINYCCNVVML